MSCPGAFVSTPSASWGADLSLQHAIKEGGMAMCHSTRPDQILQQEVGTVLPPDLGGMSGAQASACSQAVVGRRPRRPEYVWEAHKATIKALYIDRDRSLKDVMDFMKSKYGFEASAKSYKARLNRWGFSKYITDKHEREALRRLVGDGLPRQQARYPESIQLGNGAVVSLSSLVAHLERKRSSASFYPVSMLRPPDDLWISEEILSSAREYMRMQYTSVREADLDIRHSMPSPLGDFFKGFVALRRLLKEARVEDALLVLRRAPMQIRTLLVGDLVDNPYVCIYLTVLCIKWHDSMAGHMNATLKALMKYAASVVMEQSGPEPLRRILGGLIQIDDSMFREAVIQIWKCQLETWSSEVPSVWNIQQLGEWLALAETAGINQLPNSIDQVLRDTIRRHEIQYGRCSQPVLTLLWIQGEIERLRAETLNTSTENARRIFLDLLSRGDDFDSLIKYAAQYFLARDYRKSDDREQAERYLYGAVESLCELEDRPCYGISAVLELMFDLERWFVEWGEDEKAKEIHQRRLDICLAHEKRLSEQRLIVEPTQ